MTLEDLLQEELNQRTGRNCAFSAWLTSLSEKDQSTVRAMLANPGISAGFAVEFLQKNAGYPFESKDAWSKHHAFRSGSCTVCEEKK